MNYFVRFVVVLFAFSQVLHNVAAGNGLPEPGEYLGREGSPIYIYMERLRKVSRITSDEIVDSTCKDSQTLLATSFSATNDGQLGGVVGLSSNIEIRFTVPQLSMDTIGGQDVRPIYKSELWLFPKFNSPRDNRWYITTLGFVFRLEGFSRPVKAEVSNIFMRGSDECIMVDLTPQIKIIDRKLKKYDLNETLLNMTVTVHSKELFSEELCPAELEWQIICSSFFSRTTNTSFLVVKYYSDENEGLEASNRRQSAVPRMPTNSNSTQGCSLTQLSVRLQDVLGDWVASPTNAVDVGACLGECDISHSQGIPLFLKERMRNQPPNQQLRRLCIALAFYPMRILIYDKGLESYYLVNIVINAKTCGCQ